MKKMFGRNKMSENIVKEDEPISLLIDAGTSTSKLVVFEPLTIKDREEFCKAVADRVELIPTTIARAANGDFVIGHEALKHEGVMQVSYPKEEGIPRKMDDFKDFLTSIVQANLPVGEVILNEVPDMPTVFRTSIDRALKKISVKEVKWILEPVAVINRLGKGSLRAEGVGCVVDCGSGSTDIVSCQLNDKGVPEQIPHSHFSTPLGGDDMTFQLIKVLRDTLGIDYGVLNKSAPNWDYCVGIKEKLMSGETVSLETNGGKSYKLPDQSFDKIANVLFEPDIRAKGGRQILPIHEVVRMSVNASPARLHKSLYSNIIITGGPLSNDRIYNFIIKKMQQLFPNQSVRIQRPPRSETAVIEGMYVLKMAEYVKEGKKC